MGTGTAMGSGTAVGLNRINENSGGTLQTDLDNETRRTRALLSEGDRLKLPFWRHVAFSSQKEVLCTNLSFPELFSDTFRTPGAYLFFFINRAAHKLIL